MCRVTEQAQILHRVAFQHQQVGVRVRGDAAEIAFLTQDFGIDRRG